MQSVFGDTLHEGSRNNQASTRLSEALLLKRRRMSPSGSEASRFLEAAAELL